MAVDEEKNRISMLNEWDLRWREWKFREKNCNKVLSSIEVGQIEWPQKEENNSQLNHPPLLNIKELELLRWSSIQMNNKAGDTQKKR